MAAREPGDAGDQYAHLRPNLFAPVSEKVVQRLVKRHLRTPAGELGESGGVSHQNRGVGGTKPLRVYRHSKWGLTAGDELIQYAAYGHCSTAGQIINLPRLPHGQRKLVGGDYIANVE